MHSFLRIPIYKAYSAPAWRYSPISEAEASVARLRAQSTTGEVTEVCSPSTFPAFQATTRSPHQPQPRTNLSSMSFSRSASSDATNVSSSHHLDHKKDDQFELAQTPSRVIQPQRITSRESVVRRYEGFDENGQGGLDAVSPSLLWKEGGR